ncbi:MAG: hypothetical protein K0R61_4747, partial [Microvirga sp.]|nr:hypothetical protein [Microvirga sp.]
SLEGVVGIFEAGREKQFHQLVYPTLVMAAAISALVALGAFQFLSRRSQREAAAGADDADRPTGRPGSMAPNERQPSARPAHASSSATEPR